MADVTVHPFPWVDNQNPPINAYSLLSIQNDIAAIASQANAAMRAVINSAQVFTAEAQGAVGNGTTNDLTALQAACDAAAAAGGGVVQLAAGKLYGFSGPLNVRAGVMLAGSSMRQNIAPGASPSVPGLVALSASAQVLIGGGSGQTPAGVSNLHVDGNFVGGNPSSGYKGLVQITGVNVTVNQLFAIRSASDGICFNGTQNTTVTGGSSTFHVGAALVLDNGPGALAFSGGYYGTSKGGALDMRNSGTAYAYPFGPTQNTWSGTIFEAYAGQAAPIAEPYTHHVHISGRNNTFVGCNFTGGAQNSDAAAVLIDNTVSSIASSTTFVSCMWWTRSGHDAVHVTGSQQVFFVGQQVAYDDGTNHAVSFVCIDGGFPQISIDGQVDMSAPGDNGASTFRTINGGSLLTAFNYKDAGQFFRLRTGQVVGWRHEGDTGHRFYVDRDGALAWFDGTSGVPKAVVARDSSGNGLDLSVTSGAITAAGGELVATNGLKAGGARDNVFPGLGYPSSAYTIDASADHLFRLEWTAASSTTLTIANPAPGREITVHLICGAVPTITWPSSVKFAGATAPTLVANSYTILSFIYDDSAADWLETSRSVAIH